MSREQDLLAILSGQSKGPTASLARIGLSLIEPFYASATQARNTLFDRGVKTVHDLGRPTISVGNLTTGGTGKTPVVQWLVRQFLSARVRPAVLLRGYRARDGVSDEAELYRQIDGVEVEADPDRIAGAAAVLKRSPDVGVFLLDDGFQHRRAKRAFDLVLIDATNPFGHDHVLPRGLLREPAAGLRRADAILITHADERDDPLMARLRSLNPTAPVYRCRHSVRRLIDADAHSLDTQTLAPAAGVAGIGNPDAFFNDIESTFRLPLSRRIALPDHAAYDAAAVDRLNESLAGVRTVVTTEKDWVKLRRHAGRLDAAIARAVLELDFADGHADALWQQIVTAAQ
ncbi:MAG TPA: tetraacyldisaccharide 4'-kinase [Tepidisphaeraceae bacterium]|jgi:tetraacyldisaccharide 4'-kinase